MQPGSLAARVRSYFEAYVTKQRQVIEAALAEDFTFTSPYDDHIGRATYFERCWANGGRIKAIHIEAMAEAGDAVFTLYTRETTAGDRFRSAEYHRFEGNVLKAVELYFGALPKA